MPVLTVIGLMTPVAAIEHLLPGLATSGFVRDLVAGTHYVLVTTTFANNMFGAFSDTIGGQGALVTNPSTIVPEPQTYLMLTIGLAAFGAARRFRWSTISKPANRWRIRETRGDVTGPLADTAWSAVVILRTVCDGRSSTPCS